MIPPFISVIMSAYNEEKYISEAIDSILAQTYTNFEFIIINDASTDSTKDIIEGYEDDRIIILENSENTGLTKSLNVGLSAAKGSLIARMDANDISYPRRFEKQVAIFNQDPSIDLVWTGANYITSEGEFLCKKRTPPFEEVINFLNPDQENFSDRKNHINHISTMFQRLSVVDLGGYNEKLTWGQDGNLWRRMLKNNCRFHFLEEPLISVRIVRGSITTRRTTPFHMEKYDYYSRFCITHKDYGRAIYFAKQMGWGINKIKRLLSIPYFLLKDKLHG